MNTSIEIKSRQFDYSNKQTDNINFSSFAKIKSANGIDFISYEEKDDGNIIKNVLKIEQDSLTIIKYKKNISTMYFKEGIKSNSIYSTDYGNFDIDILTRKLEIKRRESSFLYDIKLEYEISIQGLFRGLNTLNIAVKES